MQAITAEVIDAASSENEADIRSFLQHELKSHLLDTRNADVVVDHIVQLSEGSSPGEKTGARKESDKVTKIIRECEEWERDVLLPLAQARLELDLDDGVKVNYLKVGEALAPVPGLALTEE